jgi:hypothetical protein
MIVGLPYQTPEIIEEELSGLLALKPSLAQFLIYGPTPGTPFFDRIMSEGLMHRDLAEDRELYYRRCTGFSAMVAHPAMQPGEIQAAQARCFTEDFRRLGPSMYRSIETWLLGYLKLKDSPNPVLRAKADWQAREIRKTYPAFLAGRLLGPGRAARRLVADLQRRIHGTFGRPTVADRLLSLVALGLAAWTGITLKLGLFQHPRTIRHTFRLPEEAPPARAWGRLRKGIVAIHPHRQAAGDHAVEVELRPEATVWVRVKGRLAAAGAETLVADLRDALRRTEDRLILDLRRLLHVEPGAAERIAEGLKIYRDRIRVAMPQTGEFAALAALFAVYR